MIEDIIIAVAGTDGSARSITVNLIVTVFEEDQYVLAFVVENVIVIRAGFDRDVIACVVVNGILALAGID